MQMRLTDKEERPFAPFALLLAGGLLGAIGYDLYYWSGVSDHRATLVHTPVYGVALLIVWLWLSWVSRDRLLRCAWLALAFNEALSMIAALQPSISPWWRRDVLVIVWAALVGLWGWRHSASRVRFVAVLILVGGLFAGQLSLDVPRRAPIVRQVPHLRPK